MSAKRQYTPICDDTLQRVHGEAKQEAAATLTAAVLPVSQWFKELCLHINTKDWLCFSRKPVGLYIRQSLHVHCDLSYILSYNLMVYNLVMHSCKYSKCLRSIFKNTMQHKKVI